MKILAILLALTLTDAAQTPTVPGSNMPADFYPPSPCVKPQKVKKDSTARTSGGSAQPWAPTVNTEVEQFNQRVLAFNTCIKLYVDNARLDTRQILDVANAAAAQATSTPSLPIGGNLPGGFYPQSPCIQPVPPESEAAARDRAAAVRRGSVRSLQNNTRTEAYSLSVQKFNAQAVVFNVCIKAYIDNAKRDIEQVQSIVRAAVADANAPMADPKGDFMTGRRR